MTADPRHTTAARIAVTPTAPRRPTSGSGRVSSLSSHGPADDPRGARRNREAAADPRYRFLARFGATILSGGIAAMPMAIYHYQAELGLAPQEVWFVGYILAHRWTAALPYPSLRQMSRRSGISTQMLHRYKQSLVEKGYLETIPRHRPSGGRTSNFYDFSGLFRALEECLVRDHRDSAWQPTADEADGEDADDLRPGAPDPAAPAGVWPRHCADPEPFVAPGPRPVPDSAPARASRLRSSGVPTSQPIVEACQPTPTEGGQRELIGGRHGALTGPKALPFLGGSKEPLPRAVEPAAPQETRASVQERPPKRDTSIRVTDAGAQRARETPERSLRAALPAHPSAASAPLVLAAPRTSRPDERWQQAVETLATQLSEAALRSWILPLAPLQAETVPARADYTGVAADGAGALRVACPTAFHREQVIRRYQALIEAAVGSRIDLVVSPSSRA